MKRTYSVIALALSFSLFIYVFYRSEKTLINELIMLFLSFDTYVEARNSIREAFPLKEAIIFSLPGGLWIFCTTILSKELYIKIPHHKLSIANAPMIFAIGLEILQLINFTNGTFDVWDLSFYLIFWLLAHTSFQLRQSKQNIASPFTIDSFMCVACFLAVYLAHVSA